MYLEESEKLWEYQPTERESDAIVDATAFALRTHGELKTFLVREYFEAHRNGDSTFLESVQPGEVRDSEEPQTRGGSEVTGPDIYCGGIWMREADFHVQFDLQALVKKAKVQYPRKKRAPDLPEMPPSEETRLATFRRLVALYCDVNAFDLDGLRAELRRTNVESEFRDALRRAGEGDLIDRKDYERWTREDFDTDPQFRSSLRQIYRYLFEDGEHP